MLQRCRCYNIAAVAAAAAATAAAAAAADVYSQFAD